MYRHPVTLLFGYMYMYILHLAIPVEWPQYDTDTRSRLTHKPQPEVVQESQEELDEYRCKLRCC